MSRIRSERYTKLKISVRHLRIRKLMERLKMSSFTLKWRINRQLFDAMLISLDTSLFPMERYQRNDKRTKIQKYFQVQKMSILSFWTICDTFSHARILQTCYGNWSVWNKWQSTSVTCVKTISPATSKDIQRYGTKKCTRLFDEYSGSRHTRIISNAVVIRDIRLSRGTHWQRGKRSLPRTRTGAESVGGKGKRRWKWKIANAVEPKVTTYY